MPKERYVRASDIGTHSFYARALHLKDNGVPSAFVREMEAGTAYHEAHGQRTRRAGRTRQLSTALILAALALLVAAWLLR